jgi:hypothetical protein
VFRQLGGQSFFRFRRNAACGCTLPINAAAGRAVDRMSGPAGRDGVRTRFDG